MSAKQLCAMLITRSLKDLSEEEEEIVVDYMDKLGIEVDLDMKPKQLCQLLLEKIMEKELKKKVPITAYANQLLGKETEKVEEKRQFLKQQELEKGRKNKERSLEETSRKLPGCAVSRSNVVAKTLYDLVVNPDLGIITMPDGTSHYSSVVSLSSDLYSNIFSETDAPVLEITSSKGNKAYVRISEIHEEPSNIVYVSPLVGYVLGMEMRGGGYLKLCTSLPNISRAKFTFYGTKETLNAILPTLIAKLPAVINAFSYLSLGMVLVTDVEGKEVKVRVDELTDTDERPIFAGLVPFGEGDLPFDIEADL